MANKTRDDEWLKIESIVLKEITQNPTDLEHVKYKLVHSGRVASRAKVEKAIASLERQKLIVFLGDYVYPNAEFIKTGTYMVKGANAIVLLDETGKKINVQRAPNSYKNGSRVKVGMFGGKNFVLSHYLGKTEVESEDEARLMRNKVLGRVVKISHDDLVFIPNDKRLPQNIPLLNPREEWPKFQDKICVMAIEGEGIINAGGGKIVEVKGDAGNPIIEYEAIAQEHGAIMAWEDDAVKAEIAKIPTTVDLSKEKLITEERAIAGERGTVDLRHLAFTTVDPKTCQDMDDAIYSTINKEGNIEVYTAVANVSKYVDLHTEIGRRYIKGAFTTYAPNHAYNILPTVLSSGICSLNENADRLAFVVKTTINPKTGLPIKSQIYDGVIKSRHKYSYEDAQKICDEHKEMDLHYFLQKVLDGKELSLEEQVILNAHSASIIKKGFAKRGMINFETKSERDVVFNESLDDIVDIKPQNHLFYHEVIEAFMITANEATAKFTLDNNIVSVYRIHGTPNEERVEQAYEFFNYLGIEFDGDLSPSGITNILNRVRGTEKEEVVNSFLVRMQTRAKYSIYNSPIYKMADVRKLQQNIRKGVVDLGKLMLGSLGEAELISHFGLQSTHYSHTTSPIRRLPDIVPHTNILAFMRGEKGISIEQAKNIVQYANDAQVQVANAEKEFAEVNGAIYCENNIGKKLSGQIVGFKRAIDVDYGGEDEFLVVVQDERTGARALIPLSDVVGIAKAKSATLAPFESALINANSQKPILTLCQPIDFVVTFADRISRLVMATVPAEKIKEDKMPKQHKVQEVKYGKEKPSRYEEKLARKIKRRQEFFDEDEIE